MPSPKREANNDIVRLEKRLDRVDTALKLVLAELRSINLRLSTMGTSNTPIPPIVRAVGKRVNKSNEDEDTGIIF